MASKETGHLGSLTPFETAKLQETWIHLLRLCGQDIPDSSSHHLPPDHTASHRQDHLQPQANLHRPNAAGNSGAVSPITPTIFRELLWNFFQAEHPDVMVLRFLRARKWDVDDALGMLLSTLKWRHEQGLDEIVARGELLSRQHHSDGTGESQLDKNLVAQYQSGKAFIRGADKSGRPVFVVRVRLHHPDAQSPESMERFVLHNIETMRSILRSQHSSGAGEKACLIFDLTGFGLKNMDFHIVKFLVLAFEARYPEYLGVVLVHNAPWVFWGIWRVVKPWLDPVIAAKIQFTTSNGNGGGKDKTSGRLTEHIDPKNLEKSLGGTDAWVYRYHPPADGENHRMGNGEPNRQARERLKAEREDLMRCFERATIGWAVKELENQGHTNGRAAGPISDGITEDDKERLQLAKKLQHNFWALDPYVRARNPCHRSSLLGPNGEVAVDYKGTS
ncbi:CRAL-TRIO domain containing protein [Rhypophila decipiens]